MLLLRGLFQWLDSRRTRREQNSNEWPMRQVMTMEAFSGLLIQLGNELKYTTIIRRPDKPDLQPAGLSLRASDPDSKRHGRSIAQAALSGFPR